MKNLFEKLQELIVRYRHINWALADQAFISGINFSLGILLARYLGLQEFGVFTLAWMAVLFVVSFQDALMISPMMSIGPKKTADEAPAYFTSVAIQQILLALFSSVLIFVGVMVFAMFLPQWESQHLAVPLTASAFAFQLQSFIRRYYFTRNRHSEAFVNDILSYGGRLVILVWLFFQGAVTSANVLWVIAGTSAFAALWGVMKEMGQVQLPSTASFFSSCRHHWAFSKWLTASALLDWTSSQLYTIAAAAYLGASAAGAMKACQNILGVLNILFLGLKNVVPVRAAKVLNKNGIKPMVAYLRKVALFGGVVTVSYALLVSITPEFWLQTIYGDEYARYGFVLQWFSAVYLLMFFSVFLRAGLMALEYTRPLFWSRVFSTTFTLLCIGPLIYCWGLTGAVAGIFFVRLINGAVLLVALKKRTKGDA